MKILVLMMMFTTSVFAQVEVIRELSRREIDYTMVIEEDSFEPNILGYACSWPGLRAPFVFNYYAELKHGSGMREDVLPIKERDLNHHFCGWPEPAEVFGEEFIVGKEIKMKILIVKELVEFEGRSIRETITTKLFGRNLESIDFLKID